LRNKRGFFYRWGIYLRNGMGSNGNIYFLLRNNTRTILEANPKNRLESTVRYGILAANNHTI
jgi:hypothetical protein